MTLLKARTRAILALIGAVLEESPRTMVRITSFTQPRRREPAMDSVRD